MLLSSVVVINNESFVDVFANSTCSPVILPPIVTSSGKPTVNVSPLTEVFTSFEVPWIFKVSPNDIVADVDESSTRVNPELDSLLFAIEPANWAFVIVPDNEVVG